MLASGNEREKGKTESSQAGKFGSRYQGGHQESFHCFRCGSPDHRVRNCLERAKGIRCCNCREVGHVAARCSKPWVPGSSSSMGNALVEQGAMDGGVKGYEARTSGSNMTPEERLEHARLRCRNHSRVFLFEDQVLQVRDVVVHC